MRQSSAHGTARPEAIRDRIKPCLEDRLQDVLHRCLDNPVFHDWDTEWPEGPRLAGFGDQHSPHRARVEQPGPKLLAYCDQEGLDPCLHDFPDRDPVYASSACAAIASHATEGHSQLSWICDQTPELRKLIVRVFSTARV